MEAGRCYGRPPHTLSRSLLEGGALASRDHGASRLLDTGMSLHAIRMIALTLTALGLAPGAAHLMELPVKLRYAPATYAEVTSTLYAWFGPIGGTVQLAATVTVGLLAYRTRHIPQGRLAAAAAGSLLASLLLWAFLVLPVNAAWAQSAGSNPAAFAFIYDQLRNRWEYGHVAAFIAWLTGWLGLAAAVTRPHAVSE